MTTAWGLPRSSDGPSIRRQITRASVGTLTVVAIVAALVAAYAFGAGPAVSLWWRVAGDADIVLADGVALSDTPVSASVPVVEPRTFSLVGDLAVLSAPLGGAGRIASTRAELVELAPWYAPGPGDLAQSLDAPVAVLGTGVLALDPSEDGAPGWILFRGGPDAPVAATPAARERLMRDIQRAWGIGGSLPGDAVVEFVHADGASAGNATYTANVVPAGCRECRVTTSDLFLFDSSGRLLIASVGTVRLVGSRTQQMTSPAQAFDDLRHHRGDPYLEVSGAAVHSARLTAGDIAGAWPLPYWEFFDADGGWVATVPADPAYL